MSGAGRVALYLRGARVGDPITAKERAAAEKFALRFGTEITAVYVEMAPADAKPWTALSVMKRDAHLRSFDLLVILAVDRFAKSFQDSVRMIADLEMRDAWMDTRNEAARAMLFGAVDAIADERRARIAKGTREGMERARREGKKLGRPRVEVDVDRIFELHAPGHSVRAAARLTGISKSKVQRTLADHPNNVGAPSSSRTSMLKTSSKARSEEHPRQPDTA